MQDLSMGGVCPSTKSLLPSLLLGWLSLYSIVSSATGSEAWRCPSGLPSTETVKTFNGHCYQFVDSEKYWTSARDYCWQHGGKLVKIGDKETNHFIVTTLNSLPWRNKGVWIGLHDNTREMGFEWVTESAYVHERLGWTHWGRGHPGAFLHQFRDCVRMVRGDGHWRWHETPCTVLKWQYKFICEYGPMGAQAAQQRPEDDGRRSTALVAGLMSFLVVIVLVSILLFLLFRRRRKQEYVEVEEPTDTSIVPIYVDDLSDIKKQMNITVNELSERRQNDYVDHPRCLPAVPLSSAATPRRSACYIEPDNVSDDDNEINDNMAPRSPDYLPMDGQKGAGEEAEGAKDDAPKKVTYDVPKPMNIYSEIPERPDIYENMYESLDDVKRKKKEGGGADE